MLINGYRIERHSGAFDAVRISCSKTNKIATLSIISFVDEATMQYVAYIPASKISAYESTLDKAYAMLEETLQYHLETFHELPDA